MSLALRKTGQIISRGKGKWLVRIFRDRDANGKRRYHSKVVVGNKSDAQKYLTSKLRERDLGVVVGNTRTTLDQYLDRWLKLIKTTIAEQTYNSYESLLRTHIRPLIGSMRLTKVTVHDVQSVVATMQEKGMSPRTIRYCHAVLSMAFRKAIELDMILKNPCAYVELPKQIRKETKAMDQEEAAMFLRAASSDKYGIVFELALITGMRPEEYLGLTWSDINLDGRNIAIRRALVWISRSGFQFCEPKTAKSRRSIPLPESLVAKLRVHRREQLERKLRLANAYSDLNLVFANEIGNPLHYRNLTQRHYEKILEAANLESRGFVLYSLRHTCATLLLAAGENPKVVSERLGHSTVRMTLDTYSHVLPDMQRSATEKLGKMLYGKLV